ncbi:hypothetical protein [Synechocystis salina]|uniref:Lipoprotein n=1 Tax=Synechocystis salina LEGE 00031 TaxID=1828736 RepID=A0ABR9VW56_9SYNC|nr:hypothetical protein [Synechocystis salina]MBE9242528.1 hypothetical protein [Synechocystis salina LEGE 00041]MBE9255600.1 hypothetical protein [Synechocystis salina LEGE 00031]
MTMQGIKGKVFLFVLIILAGCRDETRVSNEYKEMIKETINTVEGSMERYKTAAETGNVLVASIVAQEEIELLIKLQEWDEYFDKKNNQENICSVERVLYISGLSTFLLVHKALMDGVLDPDDPRFVKLNTNSFWQKTYESKKEVKKKCQLE